MKKDFTCFINAKFNYMFTCCAAVKPVQAAETEPMVSVKLKNYLGNQSSIKIKPSQSYTIADSKVTLQANTEYEVKVAGSKVNLLHNQEVLGEFDSFTAKPSTYEAFLSINNRNYLGTYSLLMKAVNTSDPSIQFLWKII
ncbi:hypothetical protein F6Y05_41345 [Bacillus megaterium]|nr:hypothetical protein [Priestia megaterium]